MDAFSLRHLLHFSLMCNHHALNDLLNVDTRSKQALFGHGKDFLLPLALFYEHIIASSSLRARISTFNIFLELFLLDHGVWIVMNVNFFVFAVLRSSISRALSRAFSRMFVPLFVSLCALRIFVRRFLISIRSNCRCAFFEGRSRIFVLINFILFLLVLFYLFRQIWIFHDRNNLSYLFRLQIILRGRIVWANRRSGFSVSLHITMLSEYLQQSLLDLHGVDWYLVIFHLLHFLIVNFHKFDVWVLFDRLQHIIVNFVKLVNSVDILEKVLQNGLLGRNVCVD